LNFAPVKFIIAKQFSQSDLAVNGSKRLRKIPPGLRAFDLTPQIHLKNSRAILYFDHSHRYASWS